MLALDQILCRESRRVQDRASHNHALLLLLLEQGSNVVDLLRRELSRALVAAAGLSTV